MNRAAIRTLFAAALAAGSVFTIAIAADVSEQKKNEISAAEAADRAAEEARKTLLEKKSNEVSAAEAADRAATGDQPAGKKSGEMSAAEAADKAAEAQDNAAASEGGAKAPSGNRTLAEAVKSEKGTLKNPFTDNKEAIAEGKQLYLNYSCNGCHGGGGGGGMCPPLTNERFVYGSNDDTLFRLIATGSDKLQAAGYSRIAKEAVVGPMPGFVDIIENEEHLWKVIAFVRSVYRGRPEKRDW